jgi:predicted esterase
MSGAALASLALGDGCRHVSGTKLWSDGRIVARPRARTSESPEGERALDLGETRDAILRVPARTTTGSLPLLVLLHGAGSSGAAILRRLGEAAAAAGLAVLAPDSRGSTWDAIRGGFGRDVEFVNQALDRVFESIAVDDTRLTIGGFSDGATYALSLGLINGDLFKRVVAFSPGFLVNGERHGQPDVFVSHGMGDTILPIDDCSRAIVENLRRRAYRVVFREFAGGHEIPAPIAREAMAWAAR